MYVHIYIYMVSIASLIKTRCSAYNPFKAQIDDKMQRFLHVTCVLITLKTAPPGAILKLRRGGEL